MVHALEASARIEREELHGKIYAHDDQHHAYEVEVVFGL